MSRITPVSTATARDYVSRYKDMPSLTMARILNKEHPKLFPSVERARNAVRYARGACGVHNRGKHPGVIAETPASRFNPLNPLDIPESSEKELLPFDFDGCKRALIIGDLHMPYHSVSAITCAIQTGVNNGCDGILINGDLLDFHGLSRFQKDPEARSIEDEMQSVTSFLGILRTKFPKARIVYRLGNHDDRYWLYLADRVPELMRSERFRKAVSLSQLLDLERLGIELVGEKRILMLGKLPTLHGHEFQAGFAPPVNPARGAYLKAKTSVLVSHHHKTSEHTETTLDRKIITTWSLGCLSGLQPAYNPHNGYNHGFAEVEIHNGDFNVSNYRVLNGVRL